MVQQLGSCSDGGTKVVRELILSDGDCRRNSFDSVCGRSLDSVQKLARGRRKGFNVTTLALSKQRVESQTALPGTTHPTDDRQHTSPDSNIDILQVMDANAAEFN